MAKIDAYEEYKEFENSKTYHRSFEIDPDIPRRDINRFIHQEAQDNESVFIKYKYADERNQELYGSSDAWYEDDIDEAWGNIDDDAEKYGISSFLGFTVVFRGLM